MVKTNKGYLLIERRLKHAPRRELDRISGPKRIFLREYDHGSIHSIIDWLDPKPHQILIESFAQKVPIGARQVSFPHPSMDRGDRLGEKNL